MHRVEEGFWQIRPLHPKVSELLHVDIFAMWRTSYACQRENVICYPHQWWHKHTFPASMCPLDTDEEARKLSARMTQLEAQIHQKEGQIHHTDEEALRLSARLTQPEAQLPHNDNKEAEHNYLSDWPTP